MEKIYVDPATRTIRTYAPTIPGSGILATTFPPSLDPAFPNSPYIVGNILVETPRGDIIANAGGIVQLPLNGLGSTMGTVTLRAGTKDAAGTIHLNKKQVTLDGLLSELIQLRVDDPDLSVIVRGDSRTKYRHIVTVMDALQQANIVKVDLATEPDKN